MVVPIKELSLRWDVSLIYHHDRSVVPGTYVSISVLLE
jgi:hypothetical protein